MITQKKSKGLNKLVGKFGERVAEKYLKLHDYRIIALNYKNKVGELDIVAEKAGTSHAIEVKTIVRRSGSAIRPEDHLDKKKINKVKSVFGMYLQQKDISDSVNLSVDGILVNIYTSPVVSSVTKGDHATKKNSYQLFTYGFTVAEKKEFMQIERNIQKITVIHMKNINIY